ncbi:MAG: FtsX-like permease family protein [Planctomycetota bacterium]
MRRLLRFVWAESRGARGRLAFAAACIALGVFAVVGVAALAEGIRTNLAARSTELIASDLRFTSRFAPEREEFPPAAELDGVRRSYVQKLATMVTTDGQRSQLVELKVVDGDFPLRGEMPLDPPIANGLDFDEALGASGCVVAPEIAAAFGLAIGDELRVGGTAFEVRALVLSEPDRIEFEFALGPRVFLSYEGFRRTELHLAQNRVTHQLLFAFSELPSERELRRVSHRLFAQHPLSGPDGLAITSREESAYQSRGGFRRGLERVERGLGLFALLSLVLGGAGVAGIVRRIVAERTGSIAVLRALGVRPREVLWLYLSLVGALALAGSLTGALAGAILPGVIVQAFDLVDANLQLGFQPFAFLRGMLLGGGVSLAFALLPLAAIYRVPPARVLDARVAPLPAPLWLRVTGGLVLVTALFVAAWLQAERARDGAFFGVGVAVLAAVLWAASWALQHATRALSRLRLPLPLRHGLAALARPASDARSATVALGLGLLAVIAVVLVERGLVDQLEGSLPANAPSAFMTDVQPDQWPAVEAALVEVGAENVQSVPVVMARLVGSDGQTGWRYRREQRLTWMEEFGASNTVIAGEAWSVPGVDEISIEADFAESIDAHLGSTLTFDVQGVPMEFLVTSLREVEWQSFAINFFLVVEPGVLEEAPHFRIAAARIAAEDEASVSAALSRLAPNVTIYWIRDILEKAVALMERLAQAVRLLGGFAVAAGLLILAGSVAAGALERTREVALLKTLGMRRRELLVRFGVEFALIGAASAVFGALGAAALAWAFFEHVLELRYDVPWLDLAATVPVTALAAALIGLVASGRALAVRPLTTLRSR